jgi:hypothetical protein
MAQPSEGGGPPKIGGGLSLYAHLLGDAANAGVVASSGPVLKEQQPPGGEEPLEAAAKKNSGNYLVQARDPV